MMLQKSVEALKQTMGDRFGMPFVAVPSISTAGIG